MKWGIKEGSVVILEFKTRKEARSVATEMILNHNKVKVVKL